MKQAHVFISGSVQGVGYRYFVKSNADKLGLKGWVRNLPAGRQGTEDGGVEAVFQGDEKVVQQMIELCKQGPTFSEVKQVGFEWEDMKEIYPDFTIRMP